MSYSSTLHNNFQNYGYTPSIIMSAVFLALFAISTSWHLYQTLQRKSLLFMLCMVVGGLVELIGWGGRVWSRYDPYGSGYIMQVCCLVIGPTWYSAALYALLALVIGTIAPNRSPLSPKMFKIFFITADVFSLVLQGAGGGIAATATTQSMGHAGSNLMLSGIVIQLVVMLIFVSYGAWFFSRSRREAEITGNKVDWLFFGIALSSLMIIIRGCYRTAELSGGFNGRLARDQDTFLLDAIPISIATFAVNFWHPCRLLPTEAEVAGLPKVYSETTLNQGEQAIGMKNY
ncbi:RTA1-domain-containing protein [Meredithblackwellia eburnea MCA 4105]